MRLAFCIALLFAACAATQARPNLPGTFGSGEALPPPVAPEPGGALAPVAVPSPPAAGAPAAPDPGAEADFRDAKARFDAGAQGEARASLEAFVAHHPQSAFRPAVDLMLARLALLRGDAVAAKRQLDPLVAAPPDAGTGSSARYYLGIAEVRLGQSARGRELLLPFLPAAGAAGPGDEALVELRGALADATSSGGDLTAALELWDGYARGGREHEKAYARVRATELAGDVSPDAAVRAWRASAERGLARAVLGAKAAATLRAQGDAAGATAMDTETTAARRASGFDDAQPQAQGSGDTGRLGLAIALTGKFQPVGEAAMRAAMLAVGSPVKTATVVPAAAPPGAAAMQLFVRDTGGEPERASKGVGELARDEGVIGILAATDRKAGATSLAAASENGVPTLALDDAPPGPASTAFGLIHAPEARVAALARAALKLGARDFAMLGPDSAAGKRLREAFRREVTGAGGRVTGDASYAPGATSFGTVVAAIKKTPPQVVFVADGADRLELIAPALAAADLWPAPWGAPRPAAAPGQPRPRTVLLLSTAAELSPRLLQNAGRYVQGALLSPGFYAAAGDARARAFVEAYRAAYGSDPHATEAYAFDGANAFRAVTAAGAKTRADVLGALGAGTFEGLTGSMRFGTDHARTDPPRIYVVAGDDIKPF